MERVKIVGAGLAGSEIALQLASYGIEVTLYEMKPTRRTPAQTSDFFAELVCSNSFRSQNPANAIGQLKREMRAADSFIMAAADRHAVPAGDALAVDREKFAAEITGQLQAHEHITIETGVVERIPDGLCVVATGPLTDDALAKDIARRAGRESLAFYDAIAPIIDADSIDWDTVWRQSRYDKGDGAAYANIPMDENQYKAFVQAVIDGDQVRAHEFEDAKYFEGCLPIEVMAGRGEMTLAFGPLKPVGLTNPKTGEQPYAVAQLRMENVDATAWNMVGFQTRLKYPAQKAIFRSLPGLQNAEFLRYGSVHRNTYLHAPSLLSDDLHFKDDSNLYFAGQITGVEGYVESTACGMLVAWHLLSRLGIECRPTPPAESAFGGLQRHLKADGILSAYAPSNLNWSLFPPIERRRREPRRMRRQRMAERAQAAFQLWWDESGLAR
ncbi:MAG: methylenetetrahydrofolate--tRNA-(uracil(54)-C(5))-methyltransferase (FADH(2)-oxidizing) TrmFO [Bradymonadia bacterium]